MNRGDIVLVRQPGSPASKARPCVIVQRDSTLHRDVAKLTVCALTSHIEVSTMVRPVILPSPGNGLRRASAVEIDWVYTHPIEVIGETIGSLDADTLVQIDAALRRWFDL